MEYGYPVIPENITVHLGAPDAPAPNVTVPFTDYIKNVASSEIYPTWPENAIRANIYAQISYALNRVYTEFYRSRGYDFDITNSTRYDQAYVHGREVFDNISRTVDDIFNSYVTKQGSIAPFFTQYCSGTTVTCPGLSQWGTVALAEEGYSPFDILQHYYGPDISLVSGAPVANAPESYPGYALGPGSAGNSVKYIQSMLGRIRRNYPSVPAIGDPEGYYLADTEAAVREFQKIFSLLQDGIVGKATWYKLIQVFNAVKGLGELTAEALTYGEVQPVFPTVLRRGDSGTDIKALQYYLDVIAYFVQGIPTVAIDGIFGPATEQAVTAFQEAYGLEPDGIVGNRTWGAIQRAYRDIRYSLGESVYQGKAAVYPGYYLSQGMTGQDVAQLQTYLSAIAGAYPWAVEIPVTGNFGELTRQAVTAVQRNAGLAPNGVVGVLTWNEIAKLYDGLAG